MNPVSAIVVFVMIWWMVLFCVLPMGQPTQYEEQDVLGTSGARKSVNIRKKILVTTIISVVLWIIACVIIQSDIIDPRQLSLEG